MIIICFRRKSNTSSHSQVLVIFEFITVLELQWRQGLVKGAELCLNPYFFCWLRSELAGCRSTLSMLKIKVKISVTKFLSFCKTLVGMYLFHAFSVKMKFLNLSLSLPLLPVSNLTIYSQTQHFSNVPGIWASLIFTQIISNNIFLCVGFAPNIRY